MSNEQPKYNFGSQQMIAERRTLQVTPDEFLEIQDWSILDTPTFLTRMKNFYGCKLDGVGYEIKVRKDVPSIGWGPPRNRVKRHVEKGESLGLNWIDDGNKVSEDK